MNENLSKFASLILALIFFSVSITTVSTINIRLRGVITAREKTNYMPSELSIKYSGDAETIHISKTKNNMIIADLILKTSREESEDIIIEVFDEKIKLSVKENNLKIAINGEYKDKLSDELIKILNDNKNINISFNYDKKLNLEEVSINEY